MRGIYVCISWLLTLVVSYWLLGGSLERLIEGYDRSDASILPGLTTLGALLISLILTLWWARGPEDSVGPEKRSRRRRFLLGAIAAFGGILASALSALMRLGDWYAISGRHIFLVRPPYQADVAREEWSGSRVARYRRLGRTEALVSDISLGSGSGTGGRQTVEVLRQAIERGVNYFDTAPDYSGANSEYRLGEAIKGSRDEIFLASKFCRPTGHLGPGHSVEEYMEAVPSSLKRLQTDRVDLIHIHSCNSVERLLDENAHEAFDRLKQQGKARFLGVSTHTPNLVEVANAAIDSDRFDVMMLAYHHGAWPQLGQVIQRAASSDIGVVAMKTLRGAKHRGLLWSRDERDSYTQAAFKWVLSDPNISCLVISLWEEAQLDEFLYASGRTLSDSDRVLLGRYRDLIAGKHCRPHCGACLQSCPEELQIDDILRYRMYFEDYGAQREATRLYAQLGKKADACTGCSAPCSNFCPEGIRIAERLAESHILLTHILLTHILLTRG